MSQIPIEADRGKTLLVISQVYVPDPASVGQHMHDAAAELVRRGWRVVVFTSNRGYDDPKQHYPSREMRDGVDIRRLPFSSFGKKSIPIRVMGQLAFLIQCVLRGLFMPKLAGLFMTTSPPMAGVAALVIGSVRRVPVTYWVMDLNPDQAVAMGKVRPDSLSVRIFDWFNRRILRRATSIVALDRFMAYRLNAKLDVRRKLHIMPPWPHDAHLETVPHDDNPFRREHGLEGKFVFMYSGNHSPSHPLNTVLEAAVRLRDRHDMKFMFIGGGLAKQDVERAISEHKLTNVVSLPYQPLDSIKYSLSAADVHLVVMGDHVVGCVHPCKVYGAMALGRPIMLLGPKPCHVSDLIADHDIGWHVSHGDVEGAVTLIEEIAATSPAKLRAMGQRAHDAVQHELSMKILRARFCDVIEAGLNPRAGKAAPTDPNVTAPAAAASAETKDTAAARAE